MYDNRPQPGVQPGMPRPPTATTAPQPNPFGNAFYGASSGLIRDGLGAYSEKIFGSSSEYVQSNDLSPYMDVSPNNHHSSLPHKQESHCAPTRQVPDDERVDEDLARAVKDVVESHRNEKDESSLKDPPGDGGVSSSSIIINLSTDLPPPKKTKPPVTLRVGMRLPYGRRIQRDFLPSDPIQLLWSTCLSELEEQDKARPFLLSLPGSAKSLDDTSQTFAELDLANSMFSATWK